MAFAVLACCSCLASSARGQQQQQHHQLQLQLQLHGGDPDPAVYTAGVIQTVPLSQPCTGSAATLAAARIANVAALKPLAQEARGKGAQIIVAPELAWGHCEKNRKDNAGYAELIPPVGTPAPPAGSPPGSAVAAAALLARELGAVFVLGGIETAPCAGNTTCPSDGRHVYNIALVFDEGGKLIAKYRKMHIFSLCKGCFDTPASVDVVTFQTSFGVEFGLFICFDLVYPHPAADLALRRGVRHIAYPTSWINYPPFLTATQMQQAWSRRFGAAVLAANNGDTGKSGSGIYVGGKALATYFNASRTGTADNAVLVAKVPKALPPLPPAPPPGVPRLPPPPPALEGHGSPRVHRPRSGSSGKPLACGLLGSATPHCSYFAPDASTDGTVESSYGNLTCTATYSFAPADRGAGVGGGGGGGGGGPTFALVAFAGVAWFVQDLGVEMCAVVQCQNAGDHLDTCIPLPKVDNPAKVGRADRAFSRLHVRGNFSNLSSPLRFGLAAGAGSELLPPDLFVPAADAGSFELRGAAVTNAALFIRTYP